MVELLEDCSGWEIEDIPDQHLVFIRVHIDHFNEQNGEFLPLAFKNRDDDQGVTAMSSDWSKYGDPGKTQEAGAQEPQSEKYHVISLGVQEIREIIPLQFVVHAPVCDDPKLPNNQAHTNILGPKSRKEFVELSKSDDKRSGTNWARLESDRVRLAFANAIKTWEIRATKPSQLA